MDFFSLDGLRVVAHILGAGGHGISGIMRHYCCLFSQNGLTPGKQTNNSMNNDILVFFCFLYIKTCGQGVLQLQIFTRSH